ncbi:amidase [Xanthobacter agilis]|uniref:Amidase n=1 Tax=Xanthobacter agilis TaxID=47492 RepID=A0ABU0L863_XANAG|nr:amidase [Xanthobacter agilis]MDQ0503349.1 amidase [Xanthobacter agilis]
MSASTATLHADALPAGEDRVGAFLPGPRVEVAGATEGPLAGLTFAVKDVLDVAGVVTGNGHPAWARTHAPAAAHAAAVQRALDAGARLVGKTISDELAYSLTGENVHYGTPLNSAAPERVPGGSSSGSAAAVAAGLVDFALGSDCGGSVRVPASYCGLLGLRPTHGRVPAAGIAPFAPSFDCVGWFARDPAVFAAVGRVLLGEDGPVALPRRLLVATDAFALLSDDVRAALAPALARVERAVAPAEGVVLAPEGLAAWSAAFRALQAAEIWQSVGPWVEAVRPEFGPGVAERFAAAARLDPAVVEAARPVRRAVVARTSSLLAEGTVLVLPTTPRSAPLKGSAAADTEVTYRHLAMNLLCTAGLAGLPQVSLPLAQVEGAPLGLSLVGRHGSDLELVTLATAICAA